MEENEAIREWFTEFVDEAEEEEYNDVVSAAVAIEELTFAEGEPIIEKEQPIRMPWMRPEAPEHNFGSDFTFQHMETSYSVNQAKKTSIRIFGTTANGNSVLIVIKSFQPYFYIYVPPHLNVHDICARLKCVTKKEALKRRSMCGYHCNRPLDTFWKITVSRPSDVSTARRLLEHGDESIVPDRTRISTFEANVPFELRFMADCRIAGSQWLTLRAGKYKILERQLSHAQYEYQVHHDDILPIPTKERGQLAPKRILFFDIEAKRKEPGFVNSATDPVICICAALYVGSIVHKVAFVLADSIAPLEEPGVDVHLFTAETEMLLAFSEHIVESDPDCFSGWNITGFDWPYLFGRADALGITDRFSRFARIRGKAAYVRKTEFTSKAYGSKKNYETMCEGRYDLDGLIFSIRGLFKKFRSYTLNAMSETVLKDHKVDILYSQIPILHEGSDEDRSRLVWYCLKDALLPARLLEKWMATVNMTEQARVTGVSEKWLMARGQGIKTHSNILRYKRADEVVPTKLRGQNNVYTVGGYVRAPIVGYYPKNVIVTLDFSSLYPSIMQAYNICYSTVISLQWARANLKPDDYWIIDRIPGSNEPVADYCFVKDHIRKGVLPDMLTDLLGQRKYVRGLMRTEPDAEVVLIYDGRQNALKVVCNSVYGFLKAFILVDPRLMSAVTNWGRFMITKCASIVEHDYANMTIVDREACERLGIDYDTTNPDRPTKKYAARIIYGDTDSIMVDIGDVGFQDAVRIGTEIAAVCTKEMRPPNSLTFESIKENAVFLKAKKYASHEIVMAGIAPGITFKEARKLAEVVAKGLEHKRRDNAMIGSKLQGGCLTDILKNRDVDAAVEQVKRAISNVLTNNVDMSMYVLSKGLSKTDKQYEESGSMPAHYTLKQKIEHRSGRTGESVPQTGDRVAYVVTAGKDQARYLAEDPVYVLANGIPINTDYYIYKQIMGATLRLFTCIWQPEKVKDIKSTWLVRDNKNLMQLEAYQKLFAPKLPHMTVRVYPKVREAAPGLMNNFVVAMPQCLHPDCNLLLSKSSRSNVVCDEHNRTDAHIALTDQLGEAERVRDESWAICNKCVGGKMEAARTCHNVTCDNFFRRQRTIVDVEDLMVDLRKFDKPEKDPSSIVVAQRRQIDKIAEAGGEEAWREQIRQQKKKKNNTRRKR